MKKIFSILIISFLMLSLISSFVLADDEKEPQLAFKSKLSTASEKGEPKLEVMSRLPSESLDNRDVVARAISDEDVEGPNGIWKDKLQRFLVSDKRKKADLSMRIAKKKMYEVADFSQTRPGKIKRIAKSYSSEIDNSLDQSSKVTDKNPKIQVLRALKQTVITKFKLENHKAKVLEVHARILEKKADQMTEDQIDHLEKIFSKIEAKIDSSIERVTKRQENLISRAVILTNFTEEEIRSLLKIYEDSLRDKKLLIENQSQIQRAKIAHQKRLMKSSAKKTLGSVEDSDLNNRNQEISSETNQASAVVKTHSSK